jgi:hypothetical protein
MLIPRMLVVFGWGCALQVACLQVLTAELGTGASMFYFGAGADEGLPGRPRAYH